MPVSIGSYRHHVTLANRSAPSAGISDGDGGYTDVFTALSPSQVWCSIKPATGRERFVSETVQATATHVVEMRYHSQVNTRTRITFGSRYLDVTGVANRDERNEVLQMTCTEVVS